MQVIKHLKVGVSDFTRPMHEGGVTGRKKNYFVHKNLPKRIENDFVLIIVEIEPFEVIKV